MVLLDLRRSLYVKDLRISVKIKNPNQDVPDSDSYVFLLCIRNYFRRFSSETVNLYLPLALLAANTLLPFLVAILALKPCLLALFLLDG